ncbi:hypothetical protein ACTWP6_27100 [Mycobacterium sp. 4D054]|uniref:hypothetical protein n=1 Tax=Mycobacterium sp. 4D054 TaxID=3457440 RepID=UPI003FCFF31F
MRLPASLQSWRRPDRHSRAYLFGRRMRLSTFGLIVAFIALYWVYENFEPPAPSPPAAPANQVVPPGFVPDPNYTWVPRTNVAPREPEFTTRTTTTTTTTTTTPTPTPTPEPTDTTTPGPIGPVVPFGPTTTVIDPDGPGPLSPQTFTQAPSAVPPTTITPPGQAPPVPPLP